MPDHALQRKGGRRSKLLFKRTEDAFHHDKRHRAKILEHPEVVNRHQMNGFSFGARFRRQLLQQQSLGKNILGVFRCHQVLGKKLDRHLTEPDPGNAAHLLVCQKDFAEGAATQPPQYLVAPTQRRTFEDIVVYRHGAYLSRTAMSPSSRNRK
jgi:hypothetical protein